MEQLKKYNSSTYNGFKITHVHLTYEGLVILETINGIYISDRTIPLEKYVHDGEVFADSILCGIQDDRNLNIQK